MNEQMKAVVFEGVTYRVPVWVNWMARNRDASIVGLENEPFIDGPHHVLSYGSWLIVHSPDVDVSWRNSAARV